MDSNRHEQLQRQDTNHHVRIDSFQLWPFNILQDCTGVPRIVPGSKVQKAQARKEAVDNVDSGLTSLLSEQLEYRRSVQIGETIMRREENSKFIVVVHHLKQVKREMQENSKDKQ